MRNFLKVGLLLALCKFCKFFFFACFPVTHRLINFHQTFRQQPTHWWAPWNLVSSLQFTIFVICFLHIFKKSSSKWQNTPQGFGKQSIKWRFAWFLVWSYLPRKFVCYFLLPHFLKYLSNPATGLCVGMQSLALCRTHGPHSSILSLCSLFYCILCDTHLPNQQNNQYTEI